MQLFETILLLLLCFYCGIMLLYLVGFFKASASAVGNQVHITHLSIVVAFKNETDNLERLLSSIAKSLEKTPHITIEVIFVDDHSTDDSLNVLIGLKDTVTFPVFSLSNETLNFGKKHAIVTGVTAANYNYITTVDADCEVSVDWLQNIQHLNAKVGIGVVIQNGVSKSVTSVMQEIEGLLLQGITVGSSELSNPLLCFRC